MPAGKRILITGLGPVSSIGIGREEFFAGLADGRSGIAEITGFDVSGREVATAAEVQDFYVEDYLESEKTYLDRCSEFALAGCALALQDAGYAEPAANVGISLGTAFGCLDTMRAFLERVIEKGPRLANPLLFSHSYPNTPGSLSAIEFSLSGFNATCCTGMSSGATAIAWAVDALRLGRAEAILAGGMEAFSETLYEGCLSQRESPVLGEGAGVILLETEDAAQRRGATPIAELAGCGMAAEPAGAIRAAREDAALGGTVEVEEALELPLKQQTGETFGAAAGLAVAAAVWQLDHGNGAFVVVSTTDPDGGCVSLVVRRTG